MNPRIDIENQLQIHGGDADILKAAMEKLSTVATDMRTAGNSSLRFACEWDPPFKQLRELSKENPGLKMTLWSDAFTRHHWICKATIANGKCEETVVSRVDDAFDGIFEEVYQCTYQQWEQNPTSPFPNSSQPS